MALQTTVNTVQPFGLAGSFYDDSPRRVAPYLVSGTDDNPATVGYAYTIDPDNPSKAVLGGDGVFAGILVSPHEYTHDGLAATLELTNGSIGQLCTMGHVIVTSATEVSVGDKVCYNQTTGEIQSFTDATAPDGYSEISGAQFILVNGAAGEQAVVELG